MGSTLWLLGNGEGLLLSLLQAGLKLAVSHLALHQRGWATRGGSRLLCLPRTAAVSLAVAFVGVATMAVIAVITVVLALVRHP